MKTFEKSQDKIQKISDQLRYEVIEPAQEEAKKIIEEAKKRAAVIHAEAEKQAEELIQEGRRTIEQERNIFESSLQQAAKQTLEALKQSIEKNLFNDQLSQTLRQATSNPQAIADLIKAVVEAIKKEGVSADLSAAIPKAVSAKEVNDLLSHEIINRLKEKSVVLEDFSGGAKVKLGDKNLTIDISEKTLEDLVSRYVRKDFRKFFFGNQG